MDTQGGLPSRYGQVLSKKGGCVIYAFTVRGLAVDKLLIIAVKRPMRNVPEAGEDKDPIEQALNYLEEFREGKVKSVNGRIIPNPSDLPGCCYIICDLTDSIINCCKVMDLTVTDDHMGYFGFHKTYKAYIEVVSYDRLVDNAKKQNQAFFEKLG